MKKFVILDCPAYSYNEQLPGFDGCLCREFEGLIKKCAERDNCVMKKLYNKFKNCSCELINLLEIEEVNE